MHIIEQLESPPEKAVHHVHENLVIDSSEEAIEKVKTKWPKMNCMIGNATDDDVLEQANIEDAYGIFPVLSSEKDNLYITTSGMPWGEAIMFCQKVLGVDHVLYAMDYPYQAHDYEVVATDSVPITYDDKKKLFQTNAERVFSL